VAALVPANPRLLFQQDDLSPRVRSRELLRNSQADDSAANQANI
jgi:hypothetical protein